MKKWLGVLLLFQCAALTAQLPATISRTDKVYGLSKFWEEVNYNFVYLNRIDREKWDSTYRSMIAAVENTPDDYSYYRLLQKFCATLHDGHTNVWMPQATANLQLTRMFGPYWLNFENIDGRAIVTRVLRSELKEIPLGSEVIEVNDIPTNRYLDDSVKPYISSSTGYVLEDEAIANLLQGPTGASYRVKIRRPDGTILPLTLRHERTSDTAFYPPFHNNPLLELKWYPNDIAYVALNSFGDQAIDSMFISKLPELYKAKALIIDLRLNGGGSTGIGTTILQYLVPDSILPHAHSYTREHSAAFTAWGKYVTANDTIGNEWNTKAWLNYHDAMIDDFGYAPDTFHLEARRLVVPTVLLIGHNTASAAEDFLIAAIGQHQMIRIGQRSFGSTGQPLLFDMPGGGGARVCTKKDTYPDGSEFVGYGVAPDIEVQPTVKEVLAGKDPALDKALVYLGKKTAGK